MVENFCRKMNFTFFPDSSVETRGFNWTYLLMHTWLRECPRKKNKVIQTGLGLGLEAQESRLLAHYQFCIHKVVGFPVRTTPRKWQHKKPKNSHHQANTNLPPFSSTCTQSCSGTAGLNVPAEQSPWHPQQGSWHQGHRWHLHGHTGTISGTLRSWSYRQKTPDNHNVTRGLRGWRGGLGSSKAHQQNGTSQSEPKMLKIPGQIKAFNSPRRTLHYCNTG